MKSEKTRIENGRLYKTELRLVLDKENQNRAAGYIQNRDPHRSVSDYITAAILHYEETILRGREADVLDRIEHTIREAIRGEALAAPYISMEPLEDSFMEDDGAQNTYQESTSRDASPTREELPDSAKDFLKGLMG